MPIPNKLSESDKAEIRKLAGEGMPEYKIAARFGITPNTVRWHLGKRNKPAKTKLAQLEPQKFIALLRAAGGRTDNVAKSLGVDADTLIDWVAGLVTAH